MIVAGREPSRKARICEAMCSRGRPASETISFATLRPSGPWHEAQVAARVRPAGLSCANDGNAVQASTAMNVRIIAPPVGRTAYCGYLEKQRPPEGGLCRCTGARLRDRRGLLLEGELDLL